jgi:hypothetical protein
MPYLVATHKAAGARVAFLGVDLEDDPAAALAWAADLRMSYPSIQDPDGVIRGNLRVPAPPVTIFVRPDGTIAGTHFGAFTGISAVRAAIDRNLGVSL